MGLLDQVIGAALGSMGQSTRQGQRPLGQPAQDQFSQMTAILTSLLAPRQAAAAGQLTRRMVSAAQPPGCCHA
jgi:hypothetical protein